MNGQKLEVMRGSGNVFRDLALDNKDVEQFKAILAAEIVKALDRDGLSLRAAHGRTGIAAADFSRIRNADLGRFTFDRLMSIINRLGRKAKRVGRLKLRLHLGVAPAETRIPRIGIFDGEAIETRRLQPLRTVPEMK